MSKKPSDTTKMLSLRREMTHLARDLRMERERAQMAMRQQIIYRDRATKAEQDAAEWKRRFDALLAHPIFQPPSAQV